jgi:hypothetical protein
VSRPRARAPGLAAALLAGLALGCGPASTAELPGDLTWTSTHFRYFARSTDADICDDLLTTLEDHFHLLQSRLGFAWPPGRVIDYYKYADDPDYLAHAPCPKGSGGCTTGTRIFTNSAFEKHELVHAYLLPTGEPPPLIAEGAAVALACNLAIPETPTLGLADALSVVDALADLRIYQTGGRLVRYLLDTYGAERFMRLYGQLGWNAGFHDLDAQLRSIYGLGADALWAATLGTPASCPEPYACSRPSLPLDGTTTMVAPICGLYGDYRVLELSADSVLAIASPRRVLISSCDPIPFHSLRMTEIDQGRPQVGLVPLPGGKHLVAFEAVRPATTIATTVSAGPWAGNDCAKVEPVVIAADDNPTVAIWLPVGQPTWLVRLRFQGPRQLSIRQGFRSSTASLKVTVCPDCNVTSEQCQTAALDTDTLSVSSNGDSVVRIDSDDITVASEVEIVGR